MLSLVLSYFCWIGSKSGFLAAKFYGNNTETDV